MSRPLIRGLDVPLVPAFAEGRLNAATPRPNWWPILRRLEVARDVARSPILDVGAGTGWLALHLHEWGHKVVASDLDAEARRNFIENMAIAGVDLPIAADDITALPYEDESFETVFCISVLTYVPDLERALREVRRVLRPGGRAVFGCLNGWGSFAFMFDRDPKTGFRNRPRNDIRQDVERFVLPGWWKARFAEDFEVDRIMPLEVLSPVFARFAGYEIDPRWTRADVRLAQHLPKELASENLFICRRPSR